MKRKQVILSFDYELFFGYKSGTVLKTLIEPTNLLLDYLEENHFKGNFFIDYLMFREMEKIDDERCASDLKLLKDQVLNMIRRGHRIELHLHPHWIDAKYNYDGTWDFSNYVHYSLSSFDINTITLLFNEGVQYLNKLASEISHGYKVCAFRAGGWAVQPFEKLRRGFEQSSIKIDSSVASGAYGKNQFSFFDFTKAPSKDYWRFSDNVCEPEVDGKFLEVPITSFHRGFLYRAIDFLSRRCFSTLKPITDGTHMRYDLKEMPHPKNSLDVAMMTMSRLSPLSVILAFLRCKHDIITYIDHPKDFSMSVKTSMAWISMFSKSITYNDLL
jgi:hypothetical protein